MLKGNQQYMMKGTSPDMRAAHMGSLDVSKFQIDSDTKMRAQN